jgi:regulator of replication initiation timing
MEDLDKYLFEMSQRIHEIVSNVQDLTEQIDSWMREADCIQHELASYDPDLDEPDLNGKEEFDHAVEHGDTDRTLP